MADHEVGRTLRFWLGRALKDTREQRIHGISPETLAPAIGISNNTLRRLEQGRGENFPRNIDTILAVYAERAGMADAVELYELALKMWREHGKPPKLPKDYNSIKPFLDLRATEADVARAADAGRKSQAAKPRDRTKRPSPDKPRNSPGPDGRQRRA